MIDEAKGKIIKYSLSWDRKGLLAYFNNHHFYHVHSNELTATEKWIKIALKSRMLKYFKVRKCK